MIQEHHLPDTFQAEEGGLHPDKEEPTSGMSLEQVEKQAIISALQRNKWKRMITCRELGISKDTLRRKIERYDLENPLDVS